MELDLDLEEDREYIEDYVNGGENVIMTADYEDHGAELVIRD